MINYKNKIITGIIIIAILAFAFWYGGDAPWLRGWDIKSKNTANSFQNEYKAKTDNPKSHEIPITQSPEVFVIEEPNKTEAKQQSVIPPSVDLPQSTIKEEIKPKTETSFDETHTEKENETILESENADNQYSEENEIKINESTEKDKYMTSVPDGNPAPIEPQDAIKSDNALTCTLSVRCDTILDNIDWFDKNKVDIVPKNGIIYTEKEVTFYEGESVFNILQREMKRNKIHMEFVNTPIYNSAYIEGIANIYEFDCGELSGWMYKVNGWFPNYGCSRYQLKEGDKVEWLYTCNLGVDIGGHNFAKGE